MQRRSSSSSPLQRFVPLPPPGARVGGREASSGAAGSPGTDARRGEPPLPLVTFGEPPGPPPGAKRPVPQIIGNPGLGVPPVIQRQLPGAERATVAGAEAAQRIRRAIRTAQRKLLRSKRKLEAEVAEARARLESVL